MAVCFRCRRPLKVASPDGLGPVCRRAVAPAPVHERDLFGFDVAKASAAARVRLSMYIDSLAADAHMAMRVSFRQARVAAGVWAS